MFSHLGKREWLATWDPPNEKKIKALWRLATCDWQLAAEFQSL